MHSTLAIARKVAHKNFRRAKPCNFLPDGTDNSREAYFHDTLVIMAFHKVWRTANSLYSVEQLGQVANNGSVIDGKEFACSAEIFFAKNFNEELMHCDGWVNNTDIYRLACTLGRQTGGGKRSRAAVKAHINKLRGAIPVSTIAPLSAVQCQMRTWNLGEAKVSRQDGTRIEDMTHATTECSSWTEAASV